MSLKVSLHVCSFFGVYEFYVSAMIPFCFYFTSNDCHFLLYLKNINALFFISLDSNHSNRNYLYLIGIECSISLIFSVGYSYYIAFFVKTPSFTFSSLTTSNYNFIATKLIPKIEVEVFHSWITIRNLKSLFDLIDDTIHWQIKLFSLVFISDSIESLSFHSNKILFLL